MKKNKPLGAADKQLERLVLQIDLFTAILLGKGEMFVVQIYFEFLACLEQFLLLERRSTLTEGGRHGEVLYPNLRVELCDLFYSVKH